MSGERRLDTSMLSTLMNAVTGKLLCNSVGGEVWNVGSAQSDGNEQCALSHEFRWLKTNGSLCGRLG